jgi:hypothetical protein
MKKPALTKRTVRLFPDKEFEAATTQITIEGHTAAPLYYYSLNGRESVISCTFKKGLIPNMSCIRTPEKASEAQRLFPCSVAWPYKWNRMGRVFFGVIEI